jgi:hypothetical protein
MHMIHTTTAPICKEISDWSLLQTDVCMSVALAKRSEFINQAHRLGDLVRFGRLSVADAADTLQEAATYNQLCFEYGTDQIQDIMAQALGFEAAAA